MEEPKEQHDASDSQGNPDIIAEPQTPIGTKTEDACAYAQTQKGTDQADKTKPKSWVTRLFRVEPDRKVELILALAITLFAAAQWITSCQNNSSTSRQVDKLIGGVSSAAAGITASGQTSQQALISFQRAYVSFYPAISMMDEGLGLTADEANGLVFSVPINNTGNTPTKNLVMHCNVKVFPSLLPKNFDFPDLDKKPFQASIPARNGIFCNPNEIIKAVDAKKAFAIQPAWHLYLWGWANYRDVFPDTPEHRTEYCYTLGSWAGNPLANVPHSASFVMCPQHNCNDEECKAN